MLLNKNKLIKIKIAIFSFLFLGPSFALAEDAQGGFVVCDDPPFCKFSEFMATVNKTMNSLFMIAMALVAIIVAIAGFKYILARGEPGKLAEVKTMLLMTLKGFLITVLAYVFIKLVLSVLGVGSSWIPAGLGNK